MLPHPSLMHICVLDYVDFLANKKLLYDWNQPCSRIFHGTKNVIDRKLYGVEYLL